MCCHWTSTLENVKGKKCLNSFNIRKVTLLYHLNGKEERDVVLDCKYNQIVTKLNIWYHFTSENTILSHVFLSLNNLNISMKCLMHNFLMVYCSSIEILHKKFLKVHFYT